MGVPGGALRELSFNSLRLLPEVYGKLVDKASRAFNSLRLLHLPQRKTALLSLALSILYDCFATHIPAYTPQYPKILSILYDCFNLVVLPLDWLLQGYAFNSLRLLQASAQDVRATWIRVSSFNSLRLLHLTGDSSIKKATSSFNSLRLLLRRLPGPAGPGGPSSFNSLRLLRVRRGWRDKVRRIWRFQFFTIASHRQAVQREGDTHLHFQFFTIASPTTLSG